MSRVESNMHNLDPLKVLTAIQQVLPSGRDFYPLHEPNFGIVDREYVTECLETGWVSSVGKFVDRFERDLADFTGASRAVAVVNGTAALHIALKLVGVQPGDEVLIPALTFVATANAVSYCGAVPHLIDCEETTLGVDAQKLDDWLTEIAIPPQQTDGNCVNRLTGCRIAAIVPMHTFGHPVNLEALIEVATRWQLPIVEDAAESLGSWYNGKHTGRYGKLGVLSFNGNKIITTGGGGAIITDDEELANRAKHLTTTAKLPHRWEFNHDEVGYNYRLPNLNAALGCAQLERLPNYLSKKRQLALDYEQAFQDLVGLNFVTAPQKSISNYWLNTILLHPTNAGMRDQLLELTNSHGIMTRPAWNPIHQLPMYAHHPRMPLVTVESLVQRLINLPSSPNLMEKL